MKKPIIGQFRLCDFVTMSGTLSAIIGIMFALNNHFTLPFVLLLVCCIADTFDGFVARLRKNSDFETTYGMELDSLSDIISFGVFPAVLALKSVDLVIINYVVPFYVLCGLIRLTYFNALNITGKSEKGYFRGVPITTISFIYPLIYLTHLINYDIYNYLTIILFVVMGVLFILNIRVKKPNIANVLKKN